MANPQVVSRILRDRGVTTVAWFDRFKVEGVSCRRGPGESVEVIVDYASRAVRDAVETQTLGALVAAGYRVAGSGGVLWASREG